MYAVIVTGGKQYRVAEGDTLRVEKLDADEGAEVVFDKVLFIGGEEPSRIGAPYVEGGAVAATVRGHGRARKVKVVKFKRRKNYLRNRGHRQDFTEVRIDRIAAAAEG